jgi:hypothetical protein
VLLDPPSPIVSPGAEDLRADRAAFHDFGHVDYGGELAHVFRLRNTDPAPVHVHDLIAGCGCTTPRMATVDAAGNRVVSRTGEKPLIAIPPGAEAELLVRIDTRHAAPFNVDKLELVRLRCDSPHTPFLTFELHLYVRRAFLLEPEVLDLCLVPESAGARGSVLVRSADPAADAALAVLSVEGPIAATLGEEPGLGARRWRLAIETVAGLARGALEGRGLLAPAGEPATPLAVRVRGQVVADVVLDPPALYLRRLGSGPTRAEAELRALVPGARIAVLASRLEGEGRAALRVEVAPIDPDAAGRSARWRVTLAADPELAPESFRGTLTLELDDPIVKQVDAPYAGAR